MSEFVEEPIYAQLARMGKALASPVRLRLLDLLERRELTVEQLSNGAGVALKNTSAQLQQLRAANLVTSRKDGTRVLYRLADPEVSEFLGRFQDFSAGRLADLRDVVAAYLGDPAELEPVAASELSGLLDDDAVVILDVRSAAEYEEGHVPGAMSVPIETLRDRLDELPSDVDIVAYCQGPYCVVSPDAVRLLREHGYRAHTLDGGLIGWVRAGGRL